MKKQILAERDNEQEIFSEALYFENRPGFTALRKNEEPFFHLFRYIESHMISACLPEDIYYISEIGYENAEDNENLGKPYIRIADNLEGITAVKEMVECYSPKEISEFESLPEDRSTDIPDSPPGMSEKDYNVETLCICYTLTQLKNRLKQVISGPPVKGHTVLDGATEEELKESIRFYEKERFRLIRESMKRTANHTKSD